MLTLGKSAVLRLCLVACAAFAAWGVVVSASGAATLPDGRKYELVSPPNKGGGEVMPLPSRTRAATSGNAVGFLSLSGFGDVAGSSVAAEYVSRRDGAANTNGWSTHSIFPKLEPISVNGAIVGLDSVYLGDFSDDFSQGILRTFTNLSGDPNLERVPNLYVRTDLLNAGEGTYQTLTSCPVCVAPLDYDFTAPSFVAATSDYGHILFETRQNLTPDTVAGGSGAPKLYEWDHGIVRDVGILPDAEGGGVSFRSVAGTGPTGPRYTLRVMSADGSRIIFTTGSNIGPLYMRENHATTVRVDGSERTDCAGDPNCGGDDVPDPSPDPAATGESRFETASADGSTIVFRTLDQLTDDDLNGGFDLYRYDASLPPEDPHNLTRLSISTGSDGGGVGSVLGASDDGSYVYFTAAGQLVSGGPAVPKFGIYMWHEGAPLEFIGSLALDDDVLINGLGQSSLTQLGARVSPDGLHLLFTSGSGEGLGGYDQTSGIAGCGKVSGSGCAEMYLYDASKDTLVCASCNPTGAPATTDASFALSTGQGAARAATHLTHALSDDGRRVFFTSGERLVAEDRNVTKRDAYMYDVPTGTLHLLSSGKSTSDSYFLDATPNGNDAFFVTREQLVGWDVDNGFDLYDARVGGGFPDPVVTNCSGDACQGPLVGPPPATVPKSIDFFSGNDNVKPNAKPKPKPKKCKKGKVRKRVHGKVTCVKKKTTHKAGKRSSTQRRAK